MELKTLSVMFEVGDGAAVGVEVEFAAGGGVGAVAELELVAVGVGRVLTGAMQAGSDIDGRVRAGSLRTVRRKR
jgi:hypothetical protein